MRDSDRRLDVQDCGARRGRVHAALGSQARAGQAAIETALLLPAIVLCLVGLLLAHRIIDARLQVETLARETARVMGEAGSVDEALARGDRRFQQVVAGLTLAPERLTVTPEVEPGLPRGSLVVVTVTYRLSPGGLLPANPELTVSATARQPVQRFGSRPPGG